MEESNVETFKVQAQGVGWPTLCTITGTKWEIQVDEPVADGGKNTGPNPMQFFSASLVACQNEQAQVVADEMKVDIQQIDIEMEVDLDLSSFMGSIDHSNGAYKTVRMSAVVKGNLSEEQVQILGQKVDARCPILGLLRSGGCVIDSKWRKVN